MNNVLEFIDFSFTEETGDCCRLFHGRGKAYDGLDHISIDWLPPVALITLYREESSDNLCLLANALKANLPACQSIQIRYRCRAMSPYEILWGDEISEFQVTENGLTYHVQLGRVQNTGLFLDMVEGRSWVRKNAQNKRVLNLFAYTCAFSVAALAGGASHVVNIDVSKSSLGKGRENHRINEQNLKKVTFEGVDIFKSYSRLKKHGPYDLLICDPPQFQKGRVDVKRDYKKIIRRVPDFLEPNGQLMLCLNSPELTDDFLLEMVFQECPQYRLLESLPAPKVFKESEAGKGLKVHIYARSV
ncbi:MAG: class I SAM-dependent methyltransferase [Proteobacteria bacterium]|nr:class I SAM-dependent methyltransferase [Pseudomonadota bacterium]